MAEPVYLDVSEPVVQRISSSLGYTGRKFKAEAADTVELTGTEWSGGSRSTYAAVRLSDGKTMPLTPAGSFMAAEGKSVVVPPGIAIVEHSIFMGKDMGLTIYIRPEDITPMLGAKKDISWAHKVVLAATAGLKSSYGGIPNFRFVEARRATGITSAEWEQAKSELIQAGLLNKAGAITNEGRNAIGSTRLDRLQRDKS